MKIAVDLYQFCSKLPWSKIPVRISSFPLKVYRHRKLQILHNVNERKYKQNVTSKQSNAILWHHWHSCFWDTVTLTNYNWIRVKQMVMTCQRQAGQYYLLGQKFSPMFCSHNVTHS